MLKTIEKNNIMKNGEAEFSSSSDDDEMLPMQGQEMFLKFFNNNNQKASGSREKSRDGSRRKL